MSRPTSVSELKLMVVKREVTLSRKMERVMRSVLAQPELLAFGTTRSVAQSSDVSAATVARLAECFGLGSFRELRILFREHVRDLSTRKLSFTAIDAKERS